MRQESVEQYAAALKAGQKYYKDAVSRGEYPYPPALDDILKNVPVAGYAELGLVDIPMNRVAGTVSVGRVAALAGNLMPLLPANSEFGAKWINLCDAHLEEGIREPVRCYEYMGRFYILEGNKRCSVLKSFGAPTVQGKVTRVVPRYSEDHDVQVYYEFMRFYELSGLYGVDFRHRGSYDRLQAALGFEPDHVWTEEEQRSFQAGYANFLAAFAKIRDPARDVTPAEALLVWLGVFSFAEIKTLPPSELTKKLTVLWPDVLAQADRDAIALETEPSGREKNLLQRLLAVGRGEHINIAFLYAFAPERSVWTLSHDRGREYLEQQLGESADIRVYTALDHDFDAALERAVAEGAELIFATTGAMIGACRRAAAAHPGVKILNCALSQPYTGVRMYYSRIHECKFITGAIAGAMADNDLVGYVANYPIFGSIASINAFALGARLSNPRARVLLRWSCLPGDPAAELKERGVKVISNREASGPEGLSRGFELGTYLREENGVLTPLATPCWNWGKMYERIVHSVFTGAWAELSRSRAVNYWWGLDSGVVDVEFSPSLPDGVCSLGWILKDGIIRGDISPFRTRITDQDGTERCDGLRDLAPEEIMTMDWLCGNVEGSIPAFEELLPMSREIVRLLGVYRRMIPPEKEGERQL